jgi:hypothetical protein
MPGDLETAVPAACQAVYQQRAPRVQAPGLRTSASAAINVAMVTS